MYLCMCRVLGNKKASWIFLKYTLRERKLYKYGDRKPVAISLLFGSWFVNREHHIHLMLSNMWQKSQLFLPHCWWRQCWGEKGSCEAWVLRHAWILLNTELFLEWMGSWLHTRLVNYSMLNTSHNIPQFRVGVSEIPTRHELGQDRERS